MSLAKLESQQDKLKLELQLALPHSGQIMARVDRTRRHAGLLARRNLGDTEAQVDEPKARSKHVGAAVKGGLPDIGIPHGQPARGFAAPFHPLEKG